MSKKRFWLNPTITWLIVLQLYIATILMVSSIGIIIFPSELSFSNRLPKNCQQVKKQTKFSHHYHSAKTCEVNSTLNHGWQQDRRRYRCTGLEPNLQAFFRQLCPSSKSVSRPVHKLDTQHKLSKHVRFLDCGHLWPLKSWSLPTQCVTLVQILWPLEVDFSCSWTRSMFSHGWLWCLSLLGVPMQKMYLHKKVK